MNTGYFISFEGGEGCGKTIQTQLLYQAFLRAGKSAKLFRSPGGTIIAENLRKIIKNPNVEEQLTPEAELMLFGACHAQMRAILKSLLNNGINIICDRFIDSTIVYQGYARHLDFTMINSINSFCVKDLIPDLTILLDISPELAINRTQKRGNVEKDRFDSETFSFHQEIRDGFLKLAEKNSNRIKIIDASKSIDEVATKIIEIVNYKFNLHLS